MTIFNYEDVGDTYIFNEKQGGTKRFLFKLRKLLYQLAFIGAFRARLSVLFIALMRINNKQQFL